MKFLFCPMASPGFVFPCVAVARELQARGHEVAFVTGPGSQRLLEEAGMPRIPRGPKDGASFQVEVWADPLSGAMQYKHLEYALGTFPADVLVGSPLSLGPLLMRERLGMPYAIIGFLTHLWPLTDTPPEELTEPEGRLRWRHQDMLRHYNRLRQLFHLPVLQWAPSESPMMGDLLLQRSIPELASLGGELPSRVHLVGACLWEPPTVDPELQRWLEEARASGDTILYVQQGRTFDSPSFWPHLQEALKGRRVRFAASVGRMDAPLEPAPPENCFLRPVVPQGAVLPYAHAVVSSGNTTSILGALTHGLPSLLLSGGGEQPDASELVERAGAAVHLSAHHLSLKRVSQLLDALWEQPSLRERARHLQAGFARVAGPQVAAHLLERLARERRPVLRDVATSAA